MRDRTIFMYTGDTYVSLLETLVSAGYHFVGFDHSNSAERKVLLRHDVDFSPRFAADLAELNNRCGVVGTFCFQLRSPLYNLCAPLALQAIHKISTLGQHVAFHFSFGEAPPKATDEVASLVATDFRIARSIVPAMKPWFSWHNPGAFPDAVEQLFDMEIPGLVNIYGREFIHDSVYRSDSNRRYTVDEWRNIVRNGDKRLHFLFHPILWVTGGRDLAEIFSLVYAELARAGHSEILKNHVWNKLHTTESVEAALSGMVKVLTAGYSGSE